MASKYQTLSNFLLSPFNRKEDLSKDISYSDKYRTFVEKNSIRIYAMCVIEDSYYIHMKVPSESQKDSNYEYDVVIRFFTDDPVVASQNNLRSYYIQFFSNSPSFMYQYAYLYHKEGFLIKALYDKIDADYIDVPPTKTNANMITSYDKSIYFACRYLSEMKFRYLDKRGPLRNKEVSEKKFFQNISDFRSVKIDATLISEEKKLKKSVDSKKKSLPNIKNMIGKKIATTSTTKKGKNSINVVKKKTSNKKITGRRK